MSHPARQHHQRYFPFHDAPQPEFAQHPPGLTVHSVNARATPPPDITLLIIHGHVIVLGPDSQINIAPPIAKDNSTSKISTGEDRTDPHALRGRRKIWGAIATTIMVLCAIAGLIVPFI